MKNLILFFTFFLAITSMTAQTSTKLITQQNNEHERLMNDFVRYANQIMQSKSTTSVKAVRLDQAMDKYQLAARKIQSESIITEYVKSMDANKQVKQDDVNAYVKQFSIDYPATNRIPNDYVRSMGDVKTNKSLAAAVELYELVGESLAASDLCKTGNCDKATTVNTKSRGAANLSWVYTGEKKYVRSRDYSGYLYRCMLVDPAKAVNDTRKRPAMNLAAKPVTKAASTNSAFEVAWKKAENVDVWDNDIRF